MRHFNKPRPDAKPDMTPMLDIVFIMLIFFIVTSTFLNEKGITLNHSKPSPHPDDFSRGVTLQILTNDQVMYSGKSIDFWSAEALLKQALTENPELAVTLYLQDGAKFKTLIKVHDIATSVGVPAHQLAVTEKHI